MQTALREVESRVAKLAKALVVLQRLIFHSHPTEVKKKKKNWRHILLVLQYFFITVLGSVEC